MRPVVLLAELNDIDLVVDGITTRLAQIAEALHEPAELKAARRALAAAQVELARCQERQQERESDQRDAEARLARSEQSLYAGKVRNPKELEDLQRDQQQLRRQESKSEDDLLDALVAVETATETLALRQVDLDRLATAWETAQTKLRVEQSRLTAQLTVAQARQASARRALPPQLLPLYDSLRARSRRAGGRRT